MFRINSARLRNGLPRLILGLSLAFLCSPAFASGGIANVTISQVDAELFPRMTVYLSARDQTGLPILGLNEGNLQISENGARVSPLQVNAVKNQRLPVTIALLIDKSQNQGDALKNVLVSANLFVATLSPQDKTLLYTFGDDVTLVNESNPAAFGNGTVAAAGAEVA